MKKAYRVSFELIGRMEIEVWYNSLSNALQAMTNLFVDRGTTRMLDSDVFFVYEYELTQNNWSFDDKTTGQISEPYKFYEAKSTSIMFRAKDYAPQEVIQMDSKIFAGLNKDELNNLCYDLFEKYR